MIGEFLCDEGDFIRGDLIGKGGFGAVYKGTSHKTGQIVAIKVVQQDSHASACEFMKYFLREVQVMSRMTHPATLSLLGCRMPDGFGQPQIIMEYCRNGSLHDIFEKLWKGLLVPDWTPTRKSKAVIGMAAGVLYIHSQGFIHRDLKPQNVLLDDNFEPRICDFGRARLDANSKSGCALSPMTSAPEAIDQNEYYTNKIDVYSFGVTLYLMFHKPDKFDDNKPIATAPFQFLTKVKRGFRFAHHSSIPEFYWELIKACWDQNPDARPSFAQIVELLREDRRWVFPGTNEADLAEYERKVLPLPNAAVPKFELGNSDSAEPAQDLGNPSAMVDVAQLAEKLVDMEDWEQGEQVRTLDDGTIYEVTRTDDQESFLMKVIDTPDGKYYMREIESMASVSHPAALALVGWRPGGNGKPAVVIMERHRKETLANIIDLTRKGKTVNGWNPTKQSMVVVGVACAMNAMHDLNIMHRDLKAEHVFLDDNFEPKVGEFGRARKDDDTAKTMASGKMYTYAPETFDEEAHYTLRVDVYSYAILLYGLFREPNVLEGAPKKVIKNQVELVGKIMEGKRFIHDPSIPSFYWNLITNCWKQLPEQRPSFADIVEILRQSNCEYAFPGANIEELKAYEAKVFPAPSSGSSSRSSVRIESVPEALAPSPPPQEVVQSSPPQQRVSTNASAPLSEVASPSPPAQHVITPNVSTPAVSPSPPSPQGTSSSQRTPVKAQAPSPPAVTFPAAQFPQQSPQRNPQQALNSQPRAVRVKTLERRICLLL